MRTVDEILKSLTLEEKASLCSGHDFWNLVGIPEKGIPQIMVTDGPHGLRKQREGDDHVGLNKSVKATCFPTASAMASSWNPALLEKVGEALGEECLQENVSVLLGPGVNIKRSPLCGRNFEYFSEDPYQSGKMATALIKGIQSKGVGTSLKHFAVNNQEKRRMTVDAVVDERALREIYLASFEEPVKAGQPETVMCAYNKVNGTYCSENEFLLTKVLKEEWGHEGLVVTDWGAANDRVKGLSAGLELEMPSSGGQNDKLIIKEIKEGRLDEEVLNKAVRRLLKMILKTAEVLEKEHRYDKDAHHELARNVSGESSVLLKNEGILPLDKSSRIAVIGAFARDPNYQGSGSSLINPHKLDSAWDSITGEFGNEGFFYAPGYDPESESLREDLISEAVKIAEKAEIALIFAGLPDVSESEGFDREHMNMPESHNALIDAVAEVTSKAVVILSNGSPVTMPWLSKVSAVLVSYLGGQAWGSAVTDLLWGKVNPSGKLAETFPVSNEATPANANFPGGSRSVHYGESIYVGYRYFDKDPDKILFPFGYGLSYTSFSYTGLKTEGPDEEGNIKVKFSLSNMGKMRGKEIAQVYVRDVESTVFRPEKELKGFVKVELEPGESKDIELTLDRRAFAYWDVGNSDWTTEAGDFEILIGRSSRDTELKETVRVESGDAVSEWAFGLRDKVPSYYNPVDLNYREFPVLVGGELPPLDIDPREPITVLHSLGDVKHKFIGRLMYKAAMKWIKKMVGEDKKTNAMMTAIMEEMPMRSIGMMGGEKISANTIQGLVMILNGRFFMGLGRIFRK